MTATVLLALMSTALISGPPPDNFRPKTIDIRVTPSCRVRLTVAPDKKEQAWRMGIFAVHCRWFGRDRRGRWSPTASKQLMGGDGCQFFFRWGVFRSRPGAVRLLVQRDRILEQVEIEPGGKATFLGQNPWGADSSIVRAHGKTATVRGAEKGWDFVDDPLLHGLGRVQRTDIVWVDYRWSYSRGKWIPRISRIFHHVFSEQ